MKRSAWTLGVVLMACTPDTADHQLPSHAGLTDDVATLAAPPRQPPPPPAPEDVAGVAFVPNTTQTTSLAIAMPLDTPGLTQTLWVRQVNRALPDLSRAGVAVQTTDTAGMVVWTMSGPAEGRARALDALLTAIATPELTDDGLAAALSTRPHSSDPADPATLRALHQQTAVTQRLWVSADAASRERLSQSAPSWSVGEALEDGGAWLDARARGWVALASCQVGNMGGSSDETIKQVAKGLVGRRTTISDVDIPLGAEAWRFGEPDVVGALYPRIDSIAVPATPTVNNCVSR